MAGLNSPQTVGNFRLGDPDVAKDRGTDGNTSGVWQSNRCLFASLFGGVYPYLGPVAINCWRKRQTGENRGQGFDCHRLGQWPAEAGVAQHASAIDRLL